ncbi:hypothetical protein KC322_g21092, partial [Hortaea werneckii]
HKLRQQLAVPGVKDLIYSTTYTITVRGVATATSTSVSLVTAKVRAATTGTDLATWLMSGGDDSLPRKAGQLAPSSNEPNTADTSSGETTTPQLQEGAFCDRCFAFTDTCYWYCYICLEGAWGFCNSCVQTGQTCTHPLLPVAHLSTLRHQASQQQDPSTVTFTQMPHLRLDTYLLLPVLTDCDICQRPIPPNRTRFHCYVCSEGDYDICTECYYSLSATGKIGQGDGPGGWRRCLRGHRLAVVGYQDIPDGQGQQRVVVRDVVGGRRHKEDHDKEGNSEEGRDTAGGGVAATAIPPPPPPEDSSLGVRCLALW